MTHTLHRIGSRESLKDDYIVLMLPSKHANNVEGSGIKFQQFYQMALDCGAIKIGDALGNEYLRGGLDKVKNACEDSHIVHALFKDLESLSNFLRAVKKAEFGISTVVEGCFDEVRKICQEIGLDMHTVNQSLGRWGRTEKLPSSEILEINAMCGHGMVSVGLIQEVIDSIKKGHSTPEEGAETLFRPCICGVFNTHRAARLLRSIVNR